VQTPKYNLFTKYFIKFLAVLLPAHGVRAVYVTTLAGEILADGDLLNSLLPELNKRFTLVNSYQVLDFPKNIYVEIWGNHPIAIRNPTTITDTELVGLAERIMRETPEWITYDTHDVVLKETIEVVQYCLKHLYHRTEENKFSMVCLKKN